MNNLDKGKALLYLDWDILNPSAYKAGVVVSNAYKINKSINNLISTLFEEFSQECNRIKKYIKSGGFNVDYSYREDLIRTIKQLKILRQNIFDEIEEIKNHSPWAYDESFKEFLEDCSIILRVPLKEELENRSLPDVNYWFNPEDGTWNPTILIDGKKARLRAGIIIVRNGSEVLLGEEEQEPGVFSLPGGAIDRGENEVDTAVKEAQEEVHIKVKNAKYTGIDYCVKHKDALPWVKENIPKKEWWYHYYTKLVIADYDSEYAGSIADEDEDISLLSTSKFYKFEDVLDEPSFKQEWKKALIKFGYLNEKELNEDITEEYNNTNQELEQYIKDNYKINPLTQRGIILSDGTVIENPLDEENYYISHGQLMQKILGNSKLRIAVPQFNFYDEIWENYGIIRINKDYEHTILLAKQRPTIQQYKALEKWLDYYINDEDNYLYLSGKHSTIGLTFKTEKYGKTLVTSSEEIIDMIKQYYRAGTFLTEELNENLDDELEYLSDKTNSEILQHLKDKFGKEDSYYRANTILDDGTIIALSEKESKLYGYGSAEHGDIIKYLNDRGIEDTNIPNTNISKFLWDNANAMRIYGGKGVELPKNEPTSKQYEYIKRMLSTNIEEIEFGTSKGNYVTYDLNYHSPNYVLGRIKRYYNAEELVENITLSNFKNRLPEEKEILELEGVKPSIVSSFNDSKGPLYLTPNGTIIDVIKYLEDKTWSTNITHKEFADSIFEEWVDSKHNRKNLIKDIILMDYLEHDLGFIRLNKGSSVTDSRMYACFFIFFKPTFIQYEKFIEFLDSSVSKEVQIYLIKEENEDQAATLIYNPKKDIPEDVIKKIKRWYTTGKLVENINLKLNNYIFNTPKRGPLFINSEGKFIKCPGNTHSTIYGFKEFDRNNYIDFADMVIKNNLIRVNDGSILDHEVYIDLLPTEPTEAQYEALTNYIDYVITKNRDYLGISIATTAIYQNYLLQEGAGGEGTDYIIDKIVQYYKTGKLIENLNIKIPKYLYHATTSDKIRSIKALGLGADISKKMWTGGVDKYINKTQGVFLDPDPYNAYSFVEISDEYDEEEQSIIVFVVDTNNLDKSKLSYDENNRVGKEEYRSFFYDGVIPYKNLKIELEENLITLSEEELLENNNIWYEDSGIDKDALWFKGTIDKVKYFGDCRNTVDKDKIWNAAQMSNVLYNSERIEPNKILDIMKDGDRKIPKVLLLNNKSEIIAGINQKQKIGWIYLIDKDLHYFFDVELEKLLTLDKNDLLENSQDINN